MLIYDIGANIGKFSIACFSKYAECKIVAVEANDSLCERLSNEFKNYNFELINKAISNIDDLEIDFYISNADTISTVSVDWIENSRFTEKYIWNNPIKKKTITIDSLLLRFPNPDIIKIDVEGYELEAISGLTKKQNKICFEWAEEQHDNIIKIFQHLENIGYEEFGHIEGDEYLLEPEVWTNKAKCIERMNIIPDRKQKWGMVWAK